jgi:DNA-binding MarR family transcriptional regulator
MAKDLTAKYLVAKNPWVDPNKLGFGDLTELGPMDEWPIGRLFMVATRVAGPAFWRIVEQHGASPAGFLLLRVLAGEDGLRAGEVAKRLMITPATVTSVVDTLERNGHVDRRRDGRDRRAVTLHITGAGRALVAETGRAMIPDLRQLYEVDEADEPAVRRFLLGLIKRAEELSKGEQP